VSEALVLASAAASRKPDDPYAHMVVCEVAIRAERVDKLKDCAQSLLRVAPELAPTHVYASLLAATEGRLGDAVAAVDRAEALGLDHQTCAKMRERYESAMPLHERYGLKALRALAIWLVGLAALLGAGALLSSLTLSAATKAPKTEDGHAKGADKLLRRIYRVVLWACCAYYYLSLPIVTSIVLIVGGGLIYGFFAIGHIPIKLVAIVAIFTLVSVWSVVKSIFFRPKASEPGDALDLSEHPKLHGVLGEVANRVGTRLVDKVYLTPGTDLAVFERGGLLAQLTGRTERCLVLGAGVLDGFEVGAFKAVLAHEYGHFHNEDTAGGGFALAVRRSMLMMAISLAQGGAAAWYNPAWLFVSGFYKIFLRISQGASRLQEILADRWAAFAYGAESFAKGLRHVIARSIRFDAHAQAALSEVIDQERALANLYRYRVRGKAPDEGDLEKAIDEALNAEPSPYDSHPSPADRLAWVEALPKRDIEASADDALEVWELFSDRTALERLMTQKVREKIQRDHGVVIAAGKLKKKRDPSAEEAADDEPAEAG
jgi:Zn-dependent protease with chaperone function